MGDTVRYCLRYSQFEENIRTNWEKIEKNFCDVTLACAEKQIQTHKIIISSSSPIFKSILKQQSNDHPLIYLTGVNSSNLQNLIDFMHQGEVNVSQEDLESFLGLADDLQVCGLWEENRKNEKL